MTTTRTELRVRLAAATSTPPWIRLWERTDVHWLGGDDALRSQADIDLAVAAVNALPALLDVADAVEAALRPAESGRGDDFAGWFGARRDEFELRYRGLRAALERLDR